MQELKKKENSIKYGLEIFFRCRKLRTTHGYLDDSFPGLSIDYHKIESSLYPDEKQFENFIEQMRYKIKKE